METNEINEVSERMQVIKSALDRSRTYPHQSGWVALVFGALSAGLAWHFHATSLSLDDAAGLATFCVGWGALFAVVLAALLWAVHRNASKHGLPMFGGALGTIAYVLAPSTLLAVVFSKALSDLGHSNLMPAAWLLCYGCGLLSASVFLNTTMKVFGLVFLVFGTAAMLYLPGPPHLMMIVGFGGLHMLLGLTLLVTQKTAAA